MKRYREFPEVLSQAAIKQGLEYNAPSNQFFVTLIILLPTWKGL